MYYINTKTMRYPMDANAIRAENPNTSFADKFVPLECYQLVHIIDKPIFDEWTQTVKELTPILKDAKWIQQWEVVPRFEEYADESGVIFTVSEQEITYRQNRDDAIKSEIRNIRNKLLTDCDWTQVKDAPIDSLIWAEYRQQLRDITNQSDFPYEVSWPSQPYHKYNR